MRTSRLCIIGASVRGAAASARRAGLYPWCADLFADADLRAIVPDAVCCQFERYPSAFAELLQLAPDGPWMYTGGLENHPELIREIAQTRPFWGNGPEALAASRCPFTVQRILRKAGLPSPDLFAGRIDASTRWLRKPLRGSAGLGICIAEPMLPTQSQVSQQLITGTPMSAVYVRVRDNVELLGVTEQLIGIDWLNAPPFRYAGSIGPVEPSPTLGNDLVRVGEAIGAGCGLLGLFGVDFILADGRPWVVEVNPRYAASIEVLERATGLQAITHHRQAFERDMPASSCHTRNGCVGKAILYAPRRLVMPKASDYIVDLDAFADIPNTGEVIESGWPLLTCFVEATTRDECLDGLRKLARSTFARIYR